MPVRIYALAKDLKLDSKDLVDIVKKAGITSKGSALASLTDDEAQRVRDHIAGSGKAEEPVATKVASTAAPAAVRDAVQPERKPIAIKVGRSGGLRKPGAASKEGSRPLVRGGVPLPPPAPEPTVPVEEAPRHRLPMCVLAGSQTRWLGQSHAQTWFRGRRAGDSIDTRPQRHQCHR